MRPVIGETVNCAVILLMAMVPLTRRSWYLHSGTEESKQESVDVVRDIMEFYYRKGEGIMVRSLPGGMKALLAEEEREGFYFRSFLHHPQLGGEEKICVTPCLQ
jgi:hypothetical protein